MRDRVLAFLLAARLLLVLPDSVEVFVEEDIFSGHFIRTFLPERLRVERRVGCAFPRRHQSITGVPTCKWLHDGRTTRTLGGLRCAVNKAV